MFLKINKMAQRCHADGRPSAAAGRMSSQRRRAPAELAGNRLGARRSHRLAMSPSSRKCLRRRADAIAPVGRALRRGEHRSVAASRLREFRHRMSHGAGAVRHGDRCRARWRRCGPRDVTGDSHPLARSKAARPTTAAGQQVVNLPPPPASARSSRSQRRGNQCDLRRGLQWRPRGRWAMASSLRGS